MRIDFCSRLFAPLNVCLWLLIACPSSLGQFPTSNMEFLSHVPLSAMGGGGGSDIWGWTDPLTSREYALFGRTNGTAFIDVTDPLSPQYLGNLPTHTGSSIWRDIKVYQEPRLRRFRWKWAAWHPDI